MKLLAAVIVALFASTALAYCTQGYFIRSYYRVVSGTQVQICVYGVNGDEVGVMFSAMKMCPMTYQVCL